MSPSTVLFIYMDKGELFHLLHFTGTVVCFVSVCVWYSFRCFLLFMCYHTYQLSGLSLNA